MGDRQVSTPAFDGRPGDGTDRAGRPAFLTTHSKTAQVNKARRGRSGQQASRKGMGISSTEWIANASAAMTTRKKK